MSDVPEVIQALFEAQLDLLIDKRDPAFLGQYSISNHLVNSLAHLVLSDGRYSRLALGDERGVLRVVPSSGLPVYGVDAMGQENYVEILVAPDRVCHYLHVGVATNAALISLDGGVTTHFYIPVDKVFLFEGLEIPAGSSIRAKNADLPATYANLVMSVW